MTASWTSLYLPCDQAVVPALQESVTALGYTLYNPFDVMPGRAYTQSVRLFVAPPVNGWTRVIGEPDVRQLPLLSKRGLCLLIALAGTDAQIEVYADGGLVKPQTALLPYLRPECSTTNLYQALQSATIGVVEQSETGGLSVLSGMAVPLDSLPQDLREMAGQVNPAQARKMFERLSGKLMGRDTADEARHLLPDAPDWNSAGGQRIRAVMACLTIPDNWREPDFVTLRDAYQVRERRRRNPSARLYPGDAEAMAKVPGALDYTPVYGGQQP